MRNRQSENDEIQFYKCVARQYRNGGNGPEGIGPDIKSQLFSISESSMNSRIFSDWRTLTMPADR